MDLDNPNNGVQMSMHAPVQMVDDLDRRRISDLEDKVERVNNQRVAMEETVNRQANQISNMEQMLARMECLLTSQNSTTPTTSQRAPDPVQRNSVKMPKLASFDGSRAKTHPFLQSLTLYF